MPSSTISSDQVRVLLVDDNPAMLARAATVLSPAVWSSGRPPMGHPPSTPRSPCTRTSSCSMSRCRGCPASKWRIRLRSAGSTAAVVFLTIHEEEDIVSAARTCGACGFVVKSRRRLRPERGGARSQRGAPVRLATASRAACPLGTRVRLPIPGPRHDDYRAGADPRDPGEGRRRRATPRVGSLTRLRGRDGQLGGPL